MNTPMKDFISIRTEVRESEGFEYRYELTERKEFYVASYGIPLYSISVRMKKVGSQRCTEGKAENLFSDLKKAMRFCNLVQVIVPLRFRFMKNADLPNLTL